MALAGTARYHRKLPTVRKGIHDGALPAMLEGGAVREVLVSRYDSN